MEANQEDSSNKQANGEVAASSIAENKDDDNKGKSSDSSGESKGGKSMLAKITGCIAQYLVFNGYLGSKLSNETSQGWKIADTVMIVVYNGVMLMLVFCFVSYTCCAIMSSWKNKLFSKSQSKAPEADIAAISSQTKDIINRSISIPMHIINQSDIKLDTKL